MSTILKALRRLEKEREAEARSLRDEVVAKPAAGGTGPRIPAIVAAGAVGAALVVASFVWIERDAAQPAPDRPAAAAAPERAAAPPAPPRVESSRVRSEFMPERAAPRVAREVPPAPRVASPALPAVAAAPEAARPEPVEPAARRAPEPAVRPLPEPVAEPVAESAPPPAPSQPAEPAASERAGIVGQPEVARRAPLPTLVVERTLWHPVPGRRVAFLQVEGRSELVKLHEGDAVGDAVVKQIDPSAVVFLHRGVEIRRRVGAGG